MPGAVLGNTHEYNPGKGTYVVGENILAGTVGTATYAAIAGRNEVSVLSKKDATLGGEQGDKKLYISLGTEVYGKVMYIKEDLAIVRILAIGDVPMNQYIEGILRKKNMREFEIDKLKVEHAFLPGDIIKARILSLGDSRKIFLTTAMDELGVLYAKNQETESIMLPYDWKEMICPVSGLKEFRKTAKPEFAHFNENEMNEEK